MKSLGRLIRARRKELGLTQAQLGERVGVQQVTVSEWENGRSVPSDMASLEQVLGLHRDEWMAAVAFGDPVLEAIYGQVRLSRDVRDALATIYKALLDASDSRRSG